MTSSGKPKSFDCYLSSVIDCIYDSGDNDGQSSKREFYEHVARQMSAPSATATSSASSTSSTMVQVMVPTDASGAIDLGSILSSVGSFLTSFLKRDDSGLYAREYVLHFPYSFQ